jgi:hypothetical protein
VRNIVSAALPCAVALVAASEKGYVSVKVTLTSPGGHSRMGSLKDDAVCCAFCCACLVVGLVGRSIANESECESALLVLV